MELTYKLEGFEGPLDLLLHLIDKNKIDIFDIPIAEITDQYLDYLRRMEEANLEIMSDFLVMAATLLDIKARLLLPPEKDEAGEEIDPRDELVQQLLEYKMYKYMSGELKDREGEASLQLYHEASIPPEVKAWHEPADPEKLLEGLTLEKLRSVFADVMKRSEDRVDPIRSTFGRIEKEPVDSKEVMHAVEQKIMKRKRCTFRSLLQGGKGKMYKVVTFLTVLELMRMGRIGVEQDGIFGEIMITAKDRSEWNQEYEEMELEE